MEVVEIDDIRAQVAQRLLALCAHEPGVIEVVVRAFDPAELAREKNLVARHALGEHLADQRLRVPAAVRVGRVPVTDAAAMRLDQRLLRLVVVVAGPADGCPFVDVGTSVAPCAEADRGDVDVGAAEANGAHGERMLHCGTAPMRLLLARLKPYKAAVAMT